ncbi:hypothetical protein A2276_04805 [candidate division WOR-1 bacterium RIFOXYA12_FULL_43_27]|uniref:histidine kinase n=1 Tax=candidate division WOR-1 bacterium RIFOXYC2_FULL_46_14 TaxID=1802587 RepID=A0A1F4U301_UNCSA|nr:MAG: hypothetical protein A2276_04805 [candidate division WOR-1 bacterium RIFOXYA12_FULL_43_27]OGC18861.1 MAG: hypothetical protein A2292_08030 [candidate division WOR-1 bacterium RIFOXYB2_FULL_46_45]OGC29002.1 MAG: hypothetical protein A2232_03095 [candidate division WOR-1 bacterium RIFOXYA2_FULL_46_56]OGC39261.1 MAG: hypothetical protein A2438_06995 [candidate division WOR-1 bacterium RIFOXYC2_FULL_46_14]
MKKKLQTQFLLLFKDEAQRYLEGLNEELLKFEKNPEDLSIMESMLRKLHNLKGAAELIGLSEIGRFVHRLEDAFLKLKEYEFSSWEFDLVFSSFDNLAKMVEASSSREEILAVDNKELYRKLKELKAKKLPKRALKKSVKIAMDGIDFSAFKADLSTFLHIDVSKVDNLMGLVNELMVHKGRILKYPARIGELLDGLKAAHRSIRLIMQDANFPAAFGGEVDKIDLQIRELRDGFNFLLEDVNTQSAQVARLADDLESSAIKMRMLPLSVIFSRMERLVHDLSREKNKKVKLVFSGEKTELDRKVIERIQDPIMHLVRNSIDHGIENPEERVKAGKLEEGVIILNGYSKGSRIIIEVEDDGAGIGKEEVMEAAIKKDLVSVEEARRLSHDQILELLFRSGFSTRGSVSLLSGRGVGLDVVRDALQELQGTIKIESQRGIFTKFILDLPMTVAVTPLLLFKLAENNFAIPLPESVEVISLDEPAERNETFVFQEEEVPLFFLDELLGFSRRDCRSVIVVNFMGRFVAVAVEAVEGEQPVVIKDLGKYLGKIKDVAGVGIMADTRLVLILDLLGMISENKKNLSIDPAHGGVEKR